MTCQKLLLLAVGVLAAQADMAFLRTEAHESTNPVEQVPVVGGSFHVNPASTSMKCVVSLTLQFFIVYTALAICRTGADTFGMKYDKIPIQKILAICRTGAD